MEVVGEKWDEARSSLFTPGSDSAIALSRAAQDRAAQDRNPESYTLRVSLCNV